MYNVVLVSIQQSESVIYIYIYPLFFRLFSHISYSRILFVFFCLIYFTQYDYL